MAEITTDETEMTRGEVAAFLRSIADELDSNRRVVSIAVGNKAVQLSPPETIGAEMKVTERSRRLRKDVETVNLEFEWNPTKETAESESEPADEAADESQPASGSESANESGSETGTGSESPSEPRSGEESETGTERGTDG